MSTPNSSRLSVSTFSLHRAIGVNYRDLPGDDGSRPCVSIYPGAPLSLLEVPERIAQAGILTLEISHPHIPSRDSGYLNELRAAIREAGVTLLSILVEAGDITDPTNGPRDEEWIGSWIETAGILGAARARVIAGKSQYTHDSIRRSIAGMRRLAMRATGSGVRLTTENWFDLLRCPESVTILMDSLEGAVGFNLDFGNWNGPTKYGDLKSIYRYAETCHAKCTFSAGYVPDAEDYCKCLELGRDCGFTGPFTLIYDGPDDDEWRGLSIEKDLVIPYL